MLRFEAFRHALFQEFYPALFLPDGMGGCFKKTYKLPAIFLSVWYMKTYNSTKTYHDLYGNISDK